MDETMGQLIGKSVERMRGDLEWTQQFLADRAKISRSWIAALEVGRIGSPGVDALEKLARAFGMRPVQFLKHIIEPYDTELTREERKLLMSFRALPTPRQGVMIEVARGLSLIQDIAN